MDQPTPDGELTRVGIPKQMSGALRMVLAATAGTLVFVLMNALSLATKRPSVLQPEPYANGPGLIGLVQRIYSSPYFVLPVVLVFTILAVTRRDQKGAWIYAFLVGGSLPVILFRWILHWI